MKKYLILLVFLLALPALLIGCNQNTSDGTAATTQPSQSADITIPAVDTFSVGYARVDITPTESVPMGGYMDTRESTGTQDPLYATCIAITDKNNNTLLFIPLDLTRSYSEAFPQVRAYVSQKTGIPVDNIITSASHTHSGPNMALTSDIRIERYNEAMKELVLRAATEAIKDRKPAQMYTAFTRAPGLNNTRHYLLNDGTYAGNGFTFSSDQILGHYGVADDLMQLLKFTREGGKDVLLVNWQGHYRAGKGTVFSSDFFGVMRSTLEKELDCQFAYIAGAGGDTVNSSKIPGRTATADYLAHGKKLSQIAMDAAKNFEKAETGEVKVLKNTFAAPSKGGANATIDIVLYAFSLGDVAFACAPYEMSGINGISIKDHSDFKMTFVATQSNSHLLYIPAEFCFDYDSYEAGVSQFARGAGEVLADEFGSMLDKLYAETGLTPAKKDDSYYYKPAEPAFDGNLYLNLQQGDLNAYKETPCGAMQIQLVSPDGPKSVLVQTKELTESILGQQIVRLLFNSSGVVVGMESGTDMGITAHDEAVTVTSRSGLSVSLTAADGTVTEGTLADRHLVIDMRGDTAGAGISLQTNDTITYLTDKDGTIILAFVSQRNPIKSLCRHCEEEVEWNEWHSTASLPAGVSGHYRLMVDVNLTKEHNINSGMLVLDLNGYTVTGAQNMRAIRVSGGSTVFALMDTSAAQTGKLVGKGTMREAGMCVQASSGIFELYSGTIDGSETHTTANGGAVHSAVGGGIIRMYGGTIIGGKTTSSPSEGGYGGSVSVAGSMVMDGGTIMNGEAYAYKNGGTYVRGGKGGNVYVASTGDFTMNGGTITGGKAEIEEDNLYVGTSNGSTGEFIHNGGTID